MKQDRVRFPLESPSIRTHIGPKEAALITARDFFHLATIGKNSWPYTQYRRGPKGFLRILDSTTLALADFRGDRQYMTDSVLLFLMDYSSQGRLKIWATTETSEDPKVIEKLTDWSYGATIDRAFLFHVLAFEWNSQQHYVQHAAGAADAGLPCRQPYPHPSSAMTSAHSRRAR